MPECRTCLGTTFAYQEMVFLVFRNVRIEDGKFTGDLEDVSKAFMPLLRCERCGDERELPEGFVRETDIAQLISAILRFRPDRSN